MSVDQKSFRSIEVESSDSDRHNVETIDKYIINYNKPWYRVPGLRNLNFWLAILTIPSVASGYDGSLLNGLQSLVQWGPYFGNPKGARLGALASAASIGSAISAFRVGDIIADRLGRRASIGIGSILLVIGAIVQGASKNYASFFIARFIVGFEFIANIGAPVLIAELAYPTHRAAATAAFSTTWYFGSILASTVTYGTYIHLSKTDEYAWRIPSYLQGALAVVCLVLLPWTPESPRFLVSKGKVEQARAVLVKFHANGDEDLGKELVDFEIKEIEIAIEYEKISKTTGFSTFFKTRTNFHRLFICVFIGFMMSFSGNALVSYYLTLVLNSIGITESKRQLQINMYLMLFNYGTSAIFSYLTNRLKRRFMFLTSVSTMLVAYIVWTVLSAINQKTNFENGSLGQGVLAMIFIFYAAYNFSLNVLPAVYSSEILPYSLRSKGYAVVSLLCYLGNIFNGFVNPIAMEAIAWKYYIVFCCLLAINLAVVYFTFVETYGYSLEEVSELVFKEKVSDTVNENKIRENGEAYSNPDKVGVITRAESV